MFIFHCHVWPEGKFDGSSPQTGTLNELARWLSALEEKYGEPCKAAVIPPFPSNLSSWPVFMDENKWLYEELAHDKYNNMFGLVNISQRDGRKAVPVLREYIGKGFVGAKIHPPVFQIKVNDPSFDEFYAIAEAQQIPIVFHTGVFPRPTTKLEDYAPLAIADVARRYPRLPILMAHVGGAALFHQALAVLQTYENCYADLNTNILRGFSNMYIPQDYLIQLLDLVGADRIIYGADTPFGRLERIEKEISVIQSWDIPLGDQEKILGGNIQNLIKQIKREALQCGF